MADVNDDRAVSVQSSNIELGEAFRDYARESILRIADKYFGQLSTASVHVSREGLLFRCTVNMQMGALKKKSADFQHEDCYIAFKNAVERVEKQLRRAKREHREDKPSRLDKDMILRDGLGASPLI